MNIISKIRVLQESYSPALAAKHIHIPGEDKFDYEYRVSKSEEEPNFTLPNNPLPRNHLLNLQDAENVIVQGNIGTGKTTLLSSIEDSLDCYQKFLSIGSSASAQGNKNLLLFTDWQKMNNKKLFLQFKDSEFIQSIYDTMLKSKPFDVKREKELLSRIMRNSNEHKEGSRAEKIAKLTGFAKKEGMEYSEFLEKYCLFVEAGLYIIKHASPEAMFGNYELTFNSKINPEKVIAKYINFYNLPGKGMSQGQKTMQILEQTQKNSTDLSLILLDEPTNSLPESKIEEVADIIRNTKGQKFIATHNTSLMDLLSKNSTVINFYENPVAMKYI